MVANKKAAKEKEDGKGKEEVQKQEVLKAEPPKMRACGCCKVVPPPPDVGQKYFEAPDGHLILGEEKTQQVKDRRNNTWVNPAR